MTNELPSPERTDGPTRETRGARPLLTLQFPGWGQVERLDLIGLSTDSGTPIVHLDQPKRHLLGQWSATAICGNDITSSVLYVSALCAAQAGALAPIVLMLVAGVLYLYRGIYAEVGNALPLNGGTYTVLLNTTSERLAASAACLTLLSYIATAVISASEAMHYAHNLTAAPPVGPATIAVLALLKEGAITESQYDRMFKRVFEKMKPALQEQIASIPKARLAKGLIVPAAPRTRRTRALTKRTSATSRP